jgi:putative membrane protein
MKRIAMVACALVAVGAIVVPFAGARTRSAGSGKSPASGLDKEYLKTSMQGDLFEIIGGKLALKRSHNAAVLRLAKRLVIDHSKSFSDAAKIARRLGVDVPKSPTPSEVWELTVVRSMHGKGFDRWYSSLEVFDHRQDIDETSDEIKDGSNKAVADDAKQDLPVLREHLKLAEAAVRATR